ncbi:MAG: tRNA (adenosine(37)-N6)-threonylcarbamoyltransferase complex ATPase subunit type 1 TsaE [Candidatus Glassbacteria bacterium]
MSEVNIVSGSPETTTRLGARVGSLIEGRFNIALVGELGSGKTVLAKGICQGLGVEGYITSPSFIIVNEYMGRLPVYHVDLYRVDSREELESTGFDDILGREGVTIIEWAEKVRGGIVPPGLDIFIQYMAEEKRALRIAARGEGGDVLLGRLRKKL